MMGCVEHTPRDYFGPNGLERVDSSPSFLPDSIPSAKSKRFKKKNSLFPIPNLQSSTSTVTSASASASVKSPTSSLAADLSQNFFIDKTPCIPTPRRSLFPSFKHDYSDTDVDVDSPLPRHKTRKESHPTPPSAQRPSKFRRTQSMYQHPEDVVMENDGTNQPTENCPLGIKSFAVKQDSFRRIERDTLCSILDGQYSQTYDQCIIIDCRFEYEYKGGHIDGAVNINTKDQLEQKMMEHANTNKKILLVFHCEYSAHRGPRMAHHLRNFDRQINAQRYPELYYPDIVILQGGYSHFFDKFWDRCVPQRYVEMNDSSHRQTCEREMNKFRRNMRIIGGRSHSYTFGNEAAAAAAVANTANAPGGSCSPVNFRFPIRKKDEPLVGQRLFV